LEKDNLSEYETYYLNRQESLLKDKKSKLNQLREVIKNTGSETSNANKDKFPINWVVGGGILLIVGIVVVLVIRKHKKKFNQKHQNR